MSGPGALVSVDMLRDPRSLLAISGQWNALAVRGESPYLSAEWLASWWSAVGPGTFCLLLRREDGSLLAGACCQRKGRQLRAAADVHTGDWDVVAADDEARKSMWRQIVHHDVGRLHLAALRDDPSSVGIAREVLEHEGFGVLVLEDELSPYLELPRSWNELLASASRNLRSQLSRRRRALEREGSLVFRTTSGGEHLERDLQAFFRLEASGWKGRSRTAILSDEKTEHLYGNFAREAARGGWLRLHLLELNGFPIAGDLACHFAGGGFLIKTGFDERYASLSPGLVLRAEALRASIEEGARFYDFLGGPDEYKLRWASHLRPRLVMEAYRGAWKAFLLYRTRLRPALKAVRDRIYGRGNGGDAAR